MKKISDNYILSSKAYDFVSNNPVFPIEKEYIPNVSYKVKRKATNTGELPAVNKGLSVYAPIKVSNYDFANAESIASIKVKSKAIPGNKVGLDVVAVTPSGNVRYYGEKLEVTGEYQTISVVIPKQENKVSSIMFSLTGYGDFTTDWTEISDLAIITEIDFSKWFDVEKTSMNILPKIENTMSKLRNGGILVSSRRNYNEKKVNIRWVTRNNADYNKIIRQVASKLYSTKVEKWVFDDDPTVYRLAKLDGDTDIEKLRTFGKTTLNFIIPDGLSHSHNLSATNGNMAVNNGTEETPPIITVVLNGLATSIKVQNVTTGEYVEVKGNYTSGSTIVFDMEKRLVTLNGNSIQKDVTIESTFWNLAVGENNLSSYHDMSLSWRERYVS